MYKKVQVGFTIGALSVIIKLSNRRDEQDERAVLSFVMLFFCLWISCFEKGVETQMNQKLEQMAAEPVIAAVKDEDGLQKALESDCSTVFLLASTILNVGDLVQRIKAAGKVAVVHIDLVEGLSNREIAVDALVQLCQPDGIISTRPGQVRRAQQLGLITVQRAFILDSMSITGLHSQLAVGKPDFIEILPGIMPRIITEITQSTEIPVIAGGLIKYKDEVVGAIRAGAVAVSTTCRAVWKM